MKEEDIVWVLQEITDLVAAPGTWREKLEEILKTASEDQMVAVREFASWFNDD